MRSILATALSLSLLGACAQTNSASVSPDDQNLLKLPDAPALFVALAPSDADEIAAAAAGFAARLGDWSHPARRIAPSVAPLLDWSPEGRAFLDAPVSGRAFAVGIPELTCPARVSSEGADGVQAGIAALGACQSQLAAAGAPETCGCALLAVDDALLAPQEVYAYAPGVSARIDSPELGLDLYLVAGESADAEGGRRLDFHPAPGERLSADIAPDGHATVRWQDESGETVVFDGRRIGDGLRRGRFAERIFATDPEGRRIRIIIGFEPVEYAVRRRELTRWPAGL